MAVEVVAVAAVGDASGEPPEDVRAVCVNDRCCWCCELCCDAFHESHVFGGGAEDHYPGIISHYFPRRRVLADAVGVGGVVVVVIATGRLAVEATNEIPSMKEAYVLLYLPLVTVDMTDSFLRILKDLPLHYSAELD